MFKKYFYIVRHGETILNSEHKRQGAEGALSDNGKKEVESLAIRLKKMKIEKIFISPYERTLETAEIINKELNINKKNIIITEFLKERKNPTIIIGKEYDYPIAKEFINIMDKTIHEEDLRLYDEENFLDLKKRALETQHFLLKNSKNKNLCVSHGIFIKMFLSTLLYGEKLSVKQYVEMNMYNVTDNAGLTLVSYDYLKKIKRPFCLFWDFFYEMFDTEKIEPENDKKIKYSPWEILAYNDSVRDNIQKLSI